MSQIKIKTENNNNTKKNYAALVVPSQMVVECGGIGLGLEFGFGVSPRETELSWSRVSCTGTSCSQRKLPKKYTKIQKKKTRKNPKKIQVCPANTEKILFFGGWCLI